MCWSAFLSVVLSVTGGLITHALGYDHPAPLIVGAIIFLAYWGVCFIVVSDDLLD